MPSILSVQQNIKLKCTPSDAYDKLTNPNYWISRSQLFVNKSTIVKVDSSHNNQPYIYYWYSKRSLKGSIRQSSSKSDSYVTYSVRYAKGTSGELTFSIANMGLYTLVNATIELELPDSFLEKVKMYLSYYFIKRDLMECLKSIALDCELNDRRVNYTIKQGHINELVAFTRKEYIPKAQRQLLVNRLYKLQENIPAEQIAGNPFVQFANSPTEDTLVVYISLPVKKGIMIRVPNTVLSTIPRAKTLFTTFNFSKESIDDVYNQLLFEAKAKKKVVEGFPVIIFDTKKRKATMHLPVS